MAVIRISVEVEAGEEEVSRLTAPEAEGVGLGPPFLFPQAAAAEVDARLSLRTCFCRATAAALVADSEDDIRAWTEPCQAMVAVESA